VVPSDAGPHRRYYGITERGRAQLEEARATWEEFERTLDALLQEEEAMTPELTA
jgi:PadR family transcriptional regulator PadR